MRGPLDQGVHESSEADGRGGGADEVGSLAGLWVAALGHVTERHEERRRGEGDVDEEHEPPRHGVDEPAAEERADRGGRAGQAGPRADRGTVIFRAEAGGDEGEAARHEHGPAHALEGSRRDQCADARREAAQDGRGGEPDQPEHEQTPAAVLVAERAAQQEQRAQGQQVAVQGPLQSREPAAQVVADVGQRHVHDRRVEERDPRAEDGGEDHPPTTRRPELDELGRSRRARRLCHDAAPRSRSSDSELMQ